MELELRPSFVLLVGLLIAASGCTTETPPLIGSDAEIPTFDAGVDAAQPTCQAGMVDCGGTCTRLAADSQNCGSCGNVCPSGLSCAVGRCDCAAPMLGCDGLCVDPSTDTQNCGGCGNVCETGETCLDGACIVECEAPDMRCSNPGDDGKPVHVCADLQTDPMNCGSCNTRCSGGAVCNAGRCACPSGQLNCSGVCTDISTDANNCGACLSSCGTDGVCGGGTCTTCGTGLSACGSPARCVDTATSRLHCGACGNACGPGESCNSGTCECLPGLVECGGTCTVLDTDPRNCGGCGIDCGRGGVCTGGACTCAAGFTMCGASCHQLEFDPDHCGACGTACATDEACRLSACVPIGSFRVTSWSATACMTLEHNAESGDDNGGIAVSDTTLFVSGDTATVRVNAADLTGLAAVTGATEEHNGLVSDLESGQVYVLLTAADTQPDGTATITQLGVLDGSTGELTATRIPLTQSISVSYDSGIFSGYQEALIADATTLGSLDWWHIALPSGVVTQLGTTQDPDHNFCENWAWWGVAERFGGVRYATYAESDTIMRIAIPLTGADMSAEVTTVATFTNLANMCSITFSPTHNRWYFHHEFDSQFTTGSEVLGSCAATYDLP